jgi:ParB/RepB/Spo0J family partition protein
MMRTSTKKTRRLATAVTPAASASRLRIVSLPIDQLDSNDYNPNELTAAQFAELVAEVRRLERPPKPVIVRSCGNRWLIVDGEHGWRAAREAGLTEVLCEVVEADDFESMRQTFKRNQHGTHHPVRLGRMFLTMMEARSLSQRELASTIDTSEGTVRNAVAYATAAGLRNGYAAESGISEEDAELAIARLTVRQVRAYVGLPAPVRDIWLNAGADLDALALAAVVRVQDEETSKITSIDFSGEGGGVDGWQELVEAGLASRITADAFVKSAHEAFRLWLFRQKFRNHIENLDAYLRPIAELHLPSVWAERLPGRPCEDRFEVLVSPERWAAILGDCVARAGDAPENLESLFKASLRLALRESGVSSLDATDPRVIELRQVVADGPAFVGDSPLSLADQCTLVRLSQSAGVEPTLALEAARQACRMLEDRDRICQGGVPAGTPQKVLGLLTGLSATTAFDAALARLRHEQTIAEGQRLVTDPERLREALLERLCAGALGENDELIAGRRVRDLMAERLGAVPLPELQLLGAAAIGCDCGARVWLDALRALHAETAG